MTNRFECEEIPSPYNFVPLAKEVVFPGWADQVSHDVPFSDGESGVLEVEITTESPTYIRNGGNWTEADRKNSESPMQDFFNAVTNSDGVEKCIIPGTSMKGAMRNVLEISSFSKMNKFSDNRYSIRDLYYNPYTEKMTEKKNGEIHSKVKTGWLCEKDGEWQLTPCKSARVEISDLKSFHGQSPAIEEKQSSVSKYTKWGQKSLNVNFSEQEGPHKHSCGKMQYTKAVGLKRGNENGTIVFTGQASGRKKNKNGKLVGKHMEFIFYSPHTESIVVTALKKDFEFIHSKDNGKKNAEWAYWSEKITIDKGVPVFYLTDSHGVVESMGLAMMYRLPYRNSIGDAINNTSKLHQDTTRLDMSELIFGHINDDALKGRVQFSHFVETDDSKKMRGESSIKTTVLGGPKPTFYPNYVKQKNKKISDNKIQGGKHATYSTLMDEDAEVRGWKRYSSEDRTVIYPNLPRDQRGNVNEDVGVKFKPLPSDSVFKGKIRFHNLKPVELGALLWTITWGQSSKCQHQVGLGKGLGQGRISIKLNSELNVSNYVVKFEEYMKSVIPEWGLSDQIVELLAMADLSKEYKGESSYPELNPDRRINEFADSKKSKRVLGRYSQNFYDVKFESKEKKAKQVEKERAKKEALASYDHAIVDEILKATNSGLKAFINHLTNSEEDLDKMEALIATYPHLKSGQKKTIDMALNKGAGGLFKQLKLVQEKTGKLFKSI